MGRVVVLIFIFMLSSRLCGADHSEYERLQEALIIAEPGSVIEIPAGEFTMPAQLSIAVDGVTLRGQGATRSILNFSQQESGAEGLFVTGTGVTLEGFAIKNPKGDGVKFSHTQNVHVDNIAVYWESKENANNGGYGIYPVITRNVLIENCYVSGASDAGIYLGQSENAIIRRNTVMGNVVGIEAENASRVDIYQNVITGNAGGLLIVNLPGLTRFGDMVRVFDNMIASNNLRNFADGGNFVGFVPSGSGVIVTAFDRVEIFSNLVAWNNTLNLLILNFHLTGRPVGEPPFDPEPRNIFVHDNEIYGGGADPKGGSAPESGDLIDALRKQIGAPFPDIMYDGISDDPAQRTVCFGENGSPKYINLNLSAGTGPSSDPTSVACSLLPLPPVALPSQFFFTRRN